MDWLLTFLCLDAKKVTKKNQGGPITPCARLASPSLKVYCCKLTFIFNARTT
jgi:hypothetical protein